MKFCTKHPKYRGKRAPKNQCTGCLNIYLTVTVRPRVEHRPTKVIKDKTKYSRKDKHKKLLAD